MQKGKDSWKYEGGISPKYYSRLCQELNLSSKNTSSKVKEFSPFSKLK
jgi:hypothetical protein